MPPRPKSKRTASLPVAIKTHKQVATRPVMLLVLGPHRSGTSLTTRMLECLGAENSSQQMWTGSDNPSGFFEDADIYALCESAFLPKLQRRWDSVSPTDWSVLSKSDRSRLGLQALEIIRRNYSLSNPLSVLKEPRINNTLPFWLSLLEHARFDVRTVCVVRDPVSTARSLAKRNMFSLAHGGMVYLTAWLSILPHLQERQVAFVQFDEIFATPGKVLAKVADRLGLPLPADFDQRVHQFSSEHLDPSLRHSVLPREDVMLEPDLPPLVADLYRVLLDAAQSQNIRKTAKFVAYAERQIENLAPLLADYDAKQSKLSSLKTEYDNAQTECAHLQSQLTDSTQQSQTAVVAERDAVTAERDALAARVSSLESAHSSLSTLHSSLVAERDGLTTRLSSLESEHSSLSTLHSSLIAERDDLATRHQQLATALEKLQGQHSSLVTALENLQGQHSSLIAERDDLVTRHQQLATALESLQSQHSSLSTTDSTLIAERNELVTALESLQGQHSSLIAERDTLSARVAAFESEHSELATRHQQLATALENLQGQNSSLIAERDALATRVTALESELADGSHLSALQVELLAERNSLSRTIKERDGTARERDQFAARLIKLEREYNVLTKSEHSLKISHRKLDERFARANAALALLKNAQDEATSLRTALASLRAENDKVAKDRDRHAARLSALEAERAKLVTRHSSLATAFEELQSQHSSLSTHHSSLSAERNELVTALEQLQGQHSSLSTLHSTLVSERDGLATRLASLTKERDELHSRANDLDISLQTRFSELAIAARALKEKEDHLQALEPIIGQSGVSLRVLEILDSHEEPPHRHLNIKLSGLQWESTRSPQDLRFRLVEHHGRPGVAIFETAPSSGNGAWTSWRETGKEAGQTYMLLVPGDQHGARALQEANGLDFYLLQFLLTAVRDQLERDIRDDTPTLQSRRRSSLAKSRLYAWHATAIALQAQLATHANLLRFDPIGTVRWEHDVESLGQSTVQLENIAFAGLFHRREQLQITINASDSCLSFSNAPMFSSVLPGCSPQIRTSHQLNFGQSSRLQFPHTLSATGTAYLASLGRVLPRIFLDGEHATFDERIQKKTIRRRLLAISKELLSLAS